MKLKKLGFCYPWTQSTLGFVVVPVASNMLLLGTGSVQFLLVGRHVFSTPIFGLLLDLEGHRAKGLQVRHTLSTSYSALVGQLFQPN